MKRETYFDGISYQPLDSKVVCVQSLGKLEDLLERGNLLLPCKVGDTIYIVYDNPESEIEEVKVESISIDESHCQILGSDGFLRSWGHKFQQTDGKRIFLERDKAILAQKELQDKISLVGFSVKDKRCEMLCKCVECTYFYENEMSQGREVCNIWFDIPDAEDK